MFTNRLRDLHVQCTFIKKKSDCTKPMPTPTLGAYIIHMSIFRIPAAQINNRSFIFFPAP